MGLEVAIILGMISLFGTLIGVSTNRENNQFIEDMNKENQDFQEKTNLQNHAWSLEAAEWEYQHNKPQTQYADLLAAGITPAAAAQQISGANVSYSPATAIAPHNMPKSSSMLNDSLQQVIGEVGDFASMEQALSSADKNQAETKVISETAIKKANSEIDKILADTLKSYSDLAVNDSNIAVNDSNIAVNDSNIAVNDAQIHAINANTDLTNEKVETERVTRRSIELSNQEKEIQLDFTRKTLEMSVEMSEQQIKLLSEQTAKLKEEIGNIQFESEYQDWRNTYIETYGVAPEQGWEDTFFKAIIDGKAEPMLDAFSESLRLIFSAAEDESRTRFDSFDEKVGRRHFPTFKDWYNRDKDWYQQNGYR